MMDSEPVLKPAPTPDSQSGLRALRTLIRERHPLAALQSFHEDLGDVFRINLPSFKPIVLVGPEAARFVLVQARNDLRWRNESDPVTELLRHGVLVEDGKAHDRLRRLMNPSLHRRMLEGYVETMWRCTQQVTDNWVDGETLDMLVEMRKIALLILMKTLYEVDFAPHLKDLWRPILASIRFISPGIWMLWHGVPRPGYRRAQQRLDNYLYSVIHARQKALAWADKEPNDLLGVLISAGLDDDLIRDQLLTLLIAGHDTSTALLAWALYLLGSHPDEMAKVTDESRLILSRETAVPEQDKGLVYLGQVIKEALRLYPPIHLGSRVAAKDLAFKGYRIPAGERVIYSIYLSQRHKCYWQNPHRFDPDRHAPGKKQAPYTWLAFGGGPRNCIGAAFGLLEAKIILGYLLKTFDFELVEDHIRPHMGATLEPHPGVQMRVIRRR